MVSTTSINSIKLVSIIVLLYCLSCTDSMVPKSKLNTQTSQSSKSTIVGKWKLVDRYDVDSRGIKLKPMLSLDLPNEIDQRNHNKEDSHNKPTISFNSQGEAFTEGLAYGFTFYLTDSTLKMGRNYKVLELNDTIMTLLEDNNTELMSLSGGFELQKYIRVDTIDLNSSRLTMKSLLLGKWKCDYLIPVRTSGNALYEIKETITDTLGPSQKKDFYFSFDTKKFEIGQESLGVSTLLKYDIADSTINVEGTHMFSILNVSNDTLSLLGPYSYEESKFIWKMYRSK